MFIPRGTTLHENLATSYVLIDNLVADLCEGGFSGVVEITLRHADAHIVIAGGRVAAGLLARHREGARAASDYAPASVEQIAASARGERGRVSVYRYSAENAEAIAGRATAELLYARLSTEFADLEKVIQKLSRESDRQWFIEVTTASGSAALVHLKGDCCRVLRASEGTLREAYESATAAENAALAMLVDEARRQGGVFDVYFRSAAEAAEASGNESHKTVPGPGDISEVVKEAKAVFQALSLDDTATTDDRHAGRALPVPSKTVSESRELTGSLGEPSNNGAAYESRPPGERVSAPSPADNVSNPTFSSGTLDEARQAAMGGRLAAPAADLLLMPDDLRATGLLKRGSQAELLAEIKRLMGEVVRTIEESLRAAGSRESFSMHLRAGQLKVADRYAFLDPFAGEFEYLAGEIVFVGEASADEFIVGLSEALAQAIDNAARASTQPERVRQHAAEGLRWLVNRQGGELELYHLDHAVEVIIEEIRNP
jgi:hypothetical protein